MSIIIVGDNERMECQYKSICKNYKCKVKIFNQMPCNFKSRIGSADLIVLFTSTVSHKMITSAVQEACRANEKVVRSHSSSSAALTNILSENCVAV